MEWKTRYIKDQQDLKLVICWLVFRKTNNIDKPLIKLTTNLKIEEDRKQKEGIITDLPLTNC